MSRLNYHHLYYFWRVATTGNLTQAARTLHVAQSALSAQIRQLESSMDTQLFERSGRKLTLTAAGQRVLSYANDIFTKGEELESLLRHGIEPEYQELRIGMLATMSRNFIEAFIAPLMRPPRPQRGRVRFSLQSRSMAHLLDGLASHQFDLILTNSSRVMAGHEDQIWQSQLLARQPLAIVGPPELRPTLPFPQGYARARWVLPSQHTEMRSAFDGFCALWQLEPDVLAEADDMAMLRLLARDSGALAVLPTVVVKDEIAQGLLLEYMTLPNIFENFYAISVKRRFVPSILTELLSNPVVLSGPGRMPTASPP